MTKTVKQVFNKNIGKDGAWVKMKKLPSGMYRIQDVKQNKDTKKFKLR